MKERPIKKTVARAAKAIMMSYLYEAHSDWLKQREQRVKSE